MHIIEKVKRTVKGQDMTVDFLFGSGRLTANPPEIKEVKGGYKILRGFGFSIKFSNGKEKKPDFYAVELWGKNAEHMVNLGFQNQLVEVCGRIEEQEYTKDGETKKNKILVIERFTCLEYKDGVSKTEANDEKATNEPADEFSENTNKVENNSSNIGEENIIPIDDNEYGDIPF